MPLVHRQTLNAGMPSKEMSHRDTQILHLHVCLRVFLPLELQR